MTIQIKPTEQYNVRSGSTVYYVLYNEQCKTRVVIGGAEFVIRV